MMPGSHRSVAARRRSATLASARTARAGGADGYPSSPVINNQLHVYQGDWDQFHPTEFLLPRIEKSIVLDEVPFIVRCRHETDWKEARLRRKIQSLGHWEYYLEFAHGLTTQINGSFNERTMDFHRYRSRLISETVAELLGPDLAGSTVLDLACHCGFFSLDMAERGVKQAHGIDVRAKNIAQAEFLRGYYGFENLSFERKNVFRLAREEKTHDVVLCLGLLYHVTQPIELLELCKRLARKFVVIETICHKQPIAGYLLATGKNTQVAIEGTRSLEFQPTYRGLVSSFQNLGFDGIIEVTGACEQPVELFSEALRRCFIWRVPEQ